MMTILIIKNNKSDNKLLEENLSSNNFRIDSCSLDTFLTKYSNKKTDLIIFDIQENLSDSIDFIKKLSLNETPIIVLSKIIDSSTIVEGLKAGAVDVIAKPYNIEELILKINLWIYSNIKDKEAQTSKQILKEYKNSVDNFSIVSKTDSNGIITYVNDKFCEISGYTRDELLGFNHNIIRHDDMDEEVFEELWTTIKTLKKPWQGKVKNRKKDGGFYWVNTFVNPILNSNGDIIEFIAIRTDITEQELLKDYFKEQLNQKTKDLSSAMKISKEYEKAINQSTILSRTNLDGVITYANDKFCELSGFNKSELEGKSHNIIKDPENPNSLYKKLWETIKKGEVWSGILKNKTKNNQNFWLDTTIVPIKDEDGKISEYLAIRHDITKLFLLQEEKELTLLYDELTKLKGRNAFSKETKNVTNKSVILLDIIEFNKINSIVGYAGGNHILRKIATLLKKKFEGNAYRLYGDIFAIVVNSNSLDVARADAIELLFEFDKCKFDYKDLDIPVSINIGITNTQPYQKTAEIAIHKNKDSFKKISIYNEQMSEQEEVLNNFKMLSKVKQALEKDQIRPFFQPIVDIKTQKTVKYEALVRLIDEGKPISPYFFLDITKRSKLYPEITKRVIKKSIEIITKEYIPVSINLSYQDITNSSIINYIALVLQSNKEIASLITFELLESDEVDNYKYIDSFIKAVKQYGCKIAIDDFGSGYSNFTKLLNMAPDIIKIDGSLIKDIYKDENSRNIVESIIILTKKSKIETVAEFIDNEKSHEIVKKMGIDYGQGYYYCKPLDLLNSQTNS